ncbi:LysE family translocator [Marinomonas spartinae]|uniref:LysE family translocator n=1 Tax=Marinomonas spartinae TaxID=1792290 RepID=UPI0018F1A968|nr:LysE family translocator [Marinomonas spartinae]MBJ7555882.1 LysE family translocator [Marinomonas spartinae]
MQEIHYGLILLAALVAMASPGPATLAIANTSMSHGRTSGLLLASGILTGSLFWSCAAALGMGAVMYANVWLFDMLRYLGGVYLLYLAYKSFLSMGQKGIKLEPNRREGGKGNRLYLRGLMIHLTNPKAILLLGSIYALGVPKNSHVLALLPLILLLGLQSAIVVFGYALLFSNPKIRVTYFKLKRLFDGVFTVFFGMAGLKLLWSPLSD